MKWKYYGRRFRPQVEILEDRTVPSNMGTVHLTDSTATIVEDTQYASKTVVYAYGNLLIDGYYDVEVVAPGGKSGNSTDTILGLSDPNSPIQVLNGHFALGSPTGPVIPGTVSGPRGDAFNVWDEVFKVSNGSQGYDNTDNPGNVYQVVIAQHIAGELQDNFSQFTGNNDVTKSKNFKADDGLLGFPHPESTLIVTNFIITEPDGTVITGPNAGGTFVVAGSIAQDFATVTVTDGTGNIVTEGTVDFQLFGPNGVLIDDTTVNVVNGVATDPFISGQLGVGDYYFVAGYSDDVNFVFLPSQSDSEPFTIVKASPGIVTNASEDGNVVGSAVLNDSATLSGGFTPGGTIDFTVTNPDGTVTDLGTVTVTGDGTYYAPNKVLATAVGTYTWHAHYSGDTNNDLADDDGTNEALVVIKASPSIITTANPTGTIFVGITAPTLSDSAVLSGGYNETGTLTFTLSGPNGFIYTKTVTVSGNGTYTASTSTETALGLYTWTATYNGDGNNNGAIDQGGSAEQVTLQGDQVSHGEAATMGFWANKNGQALLKTYGAALGNWLGTTYANLFGNLNGATGNQVAAYFLKVKAAASGSIYNTYAQSLTTALSVWVTGLGWNTKVAHYGFQQGFGGVGLGDVYYNVGSNGASFGVANNSFVKVGDLLAYFNSHCVRTGGSYTVLPTFIFYGNNSSSLLNGANNVFDGINNLGDII